MNNTVGVHRSRGTKLGEAQIFMPSSITPVLFSSSMHSGGLQQGAVSGKRPAEQNLARAAVADSKSRRGKAQKKKKTSLLLMILKRQSRNFGPCHIPCRIAKVSSGDLHCNPLSAVGAKAHHW